VQDYKWRHVLLAVGQERQSAFEGLSQQPINPSSPEAARVSFEVGEKHYD
jgi:hypothetical protein